MKRILLLCMKYTQKNIWPISWPSVCFGCSIALPPISKASSARKWKVHCHNNKVSKSTVEGNTKKYFRYLLTIRCYLPQLSDLKGRYMYLEQLKMYACTYRGAKLKNYRICHNQKQTCRMSWEICIYLTHAASMHEWKVQNGEINVVSIVLNHFNPLNCFQVNLSIDQTFICQESLKSNLTFKWTGLL